jgi:hypothetical protein
MRSGTDLRALRSGVPPSNPQDESREGDGDSQGRSAILGARSQIQAREIEPFGTVWNGFNNDRRKMALWVAQSDVLRRSAVFVATLVVSRYIVQPRQNVVALRHVRFIKHIRRGLWPQTPN